MISPRTQSILYFVCAAFGLACVMFGSYQLGYSKGYVLKESELKECAEEVSSGCPNVTSYAVMLEKENARLNKACRKKTQRAAD